MNSAANSSQSGSEGAPPLPGSSSPRRGFWAWLFSWRGARTLLLLAGLGLLVIVLAYAAENWRGRRAWNACRADLLARGKPMDFRKVIPPAVPDEQNFAATPLAQSWVEKRGSASWGDVYAEAASRVESSGNNTIHKGSRRPLDLGAWKLAMQGEDVTETPKPGETAAPRRKAKTAPQPLDLATRSNAAPAVLEGLQTSAPMLEELRVASQRPRARYGVKYDLENPASILLPHLAQVKAAVLRFQLRACAQLALGRAEAALPDVKMGFYLADTLREEPFLISHLVRIASLHLALQPVWEGLADRRWNERQLLDLQALLLEHNLAEDAIPPLDTERAAAFTLIDMAMRRGEWDATFGDGASPAGGLGAGRLLTWLVPQGWVDLEKANYSRLLDLMTEGTIDPAKRLILPARVAENEDAFTRLTAGGRFGPVASRILEHRVMASLLLPALSKSAQKAAAAQVALDEAALACGLERCRLAQGKFPENLAALVPSWIQRIPVDPVNGQPYHYGLQSDQEFFLYSVGWDGRDDRGRPGDRLFDEKHGDWIWDYPEY